jgi:hypothetical protein
VSGRYLAPTTLADALAALADGYRPVAGGTDLPAVLATLRDRTEGSDYGVYLQLADGRIVGLGGESATLEGLEIDPAAPRGGVDRGTFRSSDGASAAWVASFLRNPGARGPRAVVLTTRIDPGRRRSATSSPPSRWSSSSP